VSAVSLKGKFIAVRSGINKWPEKKSINTFISLFFPARISTKVESARE